jgi:hypothetical protein
MPEHPDEIQYTESFKFRYDTEITLALDEIIASGNRIVQFTLLPLQDNYYNWFLVVLYEPLGQEELERRQADHLLQFGKTNR